MGKKTQFMGGIAPLAPLGYVCSSSSPVNFYSLVDVKVHYVSDKSQLHDINKYHP